MATGRGRKAVEIVFKAIDQTSEYFDQLDSDLKKVDSSLKSVGIGMAATGAAILAPFAIGLSKFKDFEQQMAKVKAISRATEREFQKLEKTALDLGRTTRFTAIQAGEGMQFLAMAGMSAAEQIEAIPSVLQLAQAGAIELGQAADITTNILTSFGFAAAELVRVNDRLVATFTSANTNLIELGEAFKMVAPIAKGLGGDFEDLLATFGKLADSGIKATMAGTALRGALAALFNPTKEEEKLMRNLSARIGGVGLQIKDAEGNFVGFGNIIEQLEKAGLRADEALKLFGLRAGPGMAGLMTIGSKAIKEMTTELKASDGIAKETARIMDDTLQGAILRLTSAIDGLFISLGRSLAPAIQEIIDDFANLINWVTDLREELGPLTVVFDWLAVAIGSVLLISGTLLLSWKSLIKVKTLLLVATGKLSVGLTFLSGVLTRLGITLTASTGGLFAIAAAASLAAIAFGKLLSVMWDTSKVWNQANKAQKAYEKTADELDKKLKEISKTTGQEIKDIKTLQKLTKAGLIIFDEEKKIWISVDAEAKKAMEATIAAKEAIIKANEREVQLFKHRSKEMQQIAELEMLQLHDRVVRGQETVEEGERQKLHIQKKIIEDRLDLMEGYIDAVEQLYTRDSDEYRKAINQRMAATNALLAMGTKIVELAMQQAKAFRELQGTIQLTRVQTRLSEAIENLNAKYEEGLVATQQYFSERRKMVEDGYGFEIAQINAQIEAAEDTDVAEKLKLERMKLQSEARRELAKLTREQTDAEIALANVEQQLQRVVVESERAIDKPDTFKDLQEQELDIFKTGQQLQFEELLKTNVKKDQEALKVLALEKLRAAQGVELTEFTEQQKRDAFDRTTDIAASIAGEMQGIFSDLYAASGRQSRAFFELQKAAAMAEAIIRTHASVTGAYKDTVGPVPLKLAAGALMLAKGMAQVAAISAQKMAKGGIVPGSSPNKKADNVPIWATAGEYMHPVDTVQHYGTAFMEAIRKRLIPKNVLSGFHVPRYNQGGLVTPTATGSPNMPGNTFVANVPVTVNGDERVAGLGAELQDSIERAVIEVLKREL